MRAAFRWVSLLERRRIFEEQPIITSRRKFWLKQTLHFCCHGESKRLVFCMTLFSSLNGSWTQITKGKCKERFHNLSNLTCSRIIGTLDQVIFTRRKPASQIVKECLIRHVYMYVCVCIKQGYCCVYLDQTYRPLVIKYNCISISWYLVTYTLQITTLLIFVFYKWYIVTKTKNDVLICK